VAAIGNDFVAADHRIAAEHQRCSDNVRRQ
jgi:hypothetical protein